MNDQLRQEIVSRLKRDFSLVEVGNTNFLRKGTCPACGEKELYANSQKPWVLICPRNNHCGERQYVKDLYPDQFEDWSTRYEEEQKTCPTAAADAYLSIERGFDIEKIKGWYTQETFTDRKADHGRGASSATVRFQVATTYWERLIDKIWRFKKKAHFQYGGSYLGHWWCPPPLVGELHKQKRLYIVEGIFNAVALWLSGHAAVAAMSCNNYPEHALRMLADAIQADGRTRNDIELVWALDADAAGRKYAQRWVERSRDEDGWPTVRAAIVRQPGRSKNKLDWNDLLLRGEGQIPQKEMDEAHYLGDLLTAKTPTDKALLMHEHTGRQEFSVEHRQRLYWVKINPHEYQKAMDELREQHPEGKPVDEAALKREAMKRANTVTCICDAVPRPLYYQANKVTDESWYFFRVDFPHDGKPVKGTFSAAAINSAAEFGKRLSHVAPGVLFSGSTSMLIKMLREQLFNITRVETTDFIGYSLEHDAYILGDVAVGKDGKVTKINDEDFFDLPGGLRLKSLNQSVTLRVNPKPEEYSDAWVQHLWDAFGAKGFVSLAFWMGSMLAEQLRAEHKFYPFLEVVGQASSGKTTLIEFLWKLLGREGYEGFDPTKSSQAARARNLAQVSGMPVVLIESDRENTGRDGKPPHHKSFEWDELKTAFNGRSPRARGVATSGNETYEPPFRGAIVISQNAAVVAGEAILTRICHIHTSRADHRPGSRDAAIWLSQCPIEQVSGFALRVAGRQKDLMQTVADRMAGYVDELHKSGSVPTIRIAECHGMLMALVDALAQVVPVSTIQRGAMHELVRTMAAERQRITGQDSPTVTAFWEAFEFLDGPSTPLNHASKEGTVAINLNHIYQLAREKGVPMPLLDDVRSQLETSRRYKFVSRKNVKSGLIEIKGDKMHPACAGLAGKALFCWVFTDQDNRRWKADAETV